MKRKRSSTPGESPRSRAKIHDTSNWTDRRLIVGRIVAAMVLGASVAWRAISTARTGIIVSTAPGAGRGHNVLLITLDTCHGDHRGCYGCDRVATPVIDRLSGGHRSCILIEVRDTSRSL